MRDVSHARLARKNKKMNKFWSISKNTFVQTIRQPIYGILILITFFILLMSLSLAGWTMGDKFRDSDQKMLENMGLSTLLVSGLLVAAFSASSVLSREIEDKTAMTVISKPVSRATFVLGKFAGVLAAVAVSFYLCSLVFLLTVRHRVVPAKVDPYDWPVIILGLTAFVLVIVTALGGNFFFGWHFVSSGIWGALLLMSIAVGILSFIGKNWQIVPLGYDTPDKIAIHLPLLVGMALIFMAVIIFVAVAVAASTRLSQVMTLLVCCGVFFAGSMHSYLFGYWASSDKGIFAARIAGWIVPKLTYFFPLDALMAKEPNIPAKYVSLAAGYCTLYVAGVLTLGIGLFQRRQLEAQGGSSSMPGAVALLTWSGRISAIVGVFVAMVMVSVSGFHNPTGLAVIAGILIVSPCGWILWSRFGAGARWAYWLVCIIIFAALVLLAASAVFPVWLGFVQTAPLRVLTVAGTVFVAIILLILVLPKTRYHFKSSIKARSINTRPW